MHYLIPERNKNSSAFSLNSVSQNVFCQPVIPGKNGLDHQHVVAARGSGAKQE